MNSLLTYKFCPRCASPLKKTGENVLTCTSCKNHVFINSAATVAVIFENESKEILLTKRAFDPGKGKWDVPGGFVMPHETAEEAAVREMREELQIKIKPKQVICTTHDTYLYQEIDIPLVNIFIQAEIESGTMTCSDDVSEFKFVSRDKILTHPIWTQAVVDGIKIYLEKTTPRVNDMQL
jgi:mutator protein MutT